MIWSRKRKKGIEAVPGAADRAVPPAKALFVSDYLTQDKIRFAAPGLAKEQFIGELVDALDFSDKPLALKAVLERESAGPTVVAPGIAFPHARMEGMNGIRASLGLCPGGLAGSSEPQILLLFLGPKADMKLHLGFLASASSLFQIEGFGGLLLQQATPDAAFQAIREAEKGR